VLEELAVLIGESPLTLLFLLDLPLDEEELAPPLEEEDAEL